MGGWTGGWTDSQVNEERETEAQKGRDRERTSAASRKPILLSLSGQKQKTAGGLEISLFPDISTFIMSVRRFKDKS